MGKYATVTVKIDNGEMNTTSTIETTTEDDGATIIIGRGYLPYITHEDAQITVNVSTVDSFTPTLTSVLDDIENDRQVLSFTR